MYRTKRIILSNVIKMLMYLSGIFSLVYSIPLVIIFIKASLILGRFPTYGNPDPGEFQFFNAFNNWISIALVLWFFSFIFWVVLTIIKKLMLKENILRIEWKLTAIAHFMSILVTFSPIFEWYVD